MEEKNITTAFELAKEQYASLDVDVEKALKIVNDIPISLHCWQADDVAGFEKEDSELGGGGIQVTGNYPGKANSIDEMRQDVEMALSLLPGKHKFNLHAIYGDFSTFTDRDKIEPKDFASWVEWAKENNLGLDFNATCFSHPKADDGFTLSSKDAGIRKFWIEHVKQCRKIGAYFGKELGMPSIHNTWIPDGMKDIPADRFGYRENLKNSLDEIFKTEYSTEHLKDSLESKLFGIGSESMVVGSHEFYMGYAVKNNKLICLDNGHFHPTEQIGDKISACLQFVDELMLHVTRGVRWDSDHIPIFNDEILLIAQEIIRSNALNRVNIGLDFFDATLNRVGAYVIGTRAARKALLFALLEPTDKLKAAEAEGNFFKRLACMEALKTMPFGTVWNYYCISNGIATDRDYIDKVMDYETNVLSKR